MLPSVWMSMLTLHVSKRTEGASWRDVEVCLASAADGSLGFPKRRVVMMNCSHHLRRKNRLRRRAKASNTFKDSIHTPCHLENHSNSSTGPIASCQLLIGVTA